MESSVPKDSGYSRKRDDLVLSVQSGAWTLHVSIAQNINWALLRKQPTKI